MPYITLFPPDNKPMNYANATDVHVDEQSGVLTFYHKDSGTGASRKFTTTLRYMIVEQVG